MDRDQHPLDILIFAEDPGAANYLAPIAEACKTHGWKCRILANGFAEKMFSDLGLEFEPCTRKTSDAASIIHDLKPKMLLVGTAENPESLGLYLIQAARDAEIITVGAVDAFMNARHRFSGKSDNPHAFAPDFLLVTDDSTRSAFKALGFSPDSVVVCGHPQYDKVLALRKELETTPSEKWRDKYFPAIPPSQKIVLFLDEGSARLLSQGDFEPQKYDFKGFAGAAAGRTELILEEFICACEQQSPRPHIVLRLHPKDEAGDFEPYLPRLDAINKGGRAHELLMASDLVVGLTTILLTEAALLGRKTLSIVPTRAEGDWLPSVREGVTPCASDRDELARQLPALLGHKPLQATSVKKFVLEGSVEAVMRLIRSFLGHR